MKRLLAMAILIAPFLAFPAESPADGLSGSVTAGGTYVDLDRESFKYGEYTGMTKTGLYFVGNANINYVKDSYYLDLNAKDAGLPDRSVRLDGGKFGKYGAFLFFDEVPHFISNNSRTPFDGAGGPVLTLPSGFVNGQTTPDMTNLSSNLKDVRLKLQRQKYGGGFADNLGKGFSFAFSLDRETKKGIKSLGGALGTSGNADTRSIVLPEPVDYTTDTLRASLAYASRRVQAEFQYFLSSFRNANRAVTWDDPFFVPAPGSATALYPAVAKTSLPPDNIQQKFIFTGGLSLPWWYTRALVTAEYGISRQNESLLPYSNNPLSVINTPLPRSTADAEIDVKHLTMSLSSKPLSRLSLAAKFRHYETDNRTPLALFQYVKNDSAFGPAGDYHQANLTDSYALFSLPFDYRQNLYRFDASYYVFRATTVRAGYDYELVDRSLRAVNTTRESTYRAAAQTEIIPATSVNINYSLSLRKAKDPYNQMNSFAAMNTQQYMSTLAPDAFDENPRLRQFDVADRRRIKYGASISFFPSDKITGSLYYNYWRDFYENSPLGLRFSRNQSFTADFTVAPVKYASFYGFYTREESRLLESGNSFTDTLAATQSVDPTLDWQMRNNGNVDTYGAGANFGFLDNRLIFNADYSYSFATNAIKFAAGSSLPAPKDMPLIKNALYSARLGGKYRVLKNLDAGLRFAYDRYRATNWQTDGVDPGSTVLANVLTLSGSTPDYRAVSATAFLTYYLGS